MSPHLWAFGAVACAALGVSLALSIALVVLLKLT